MTVYRGYFDDLEGKAILDMWDGIKPDNKVYFKTPKEAQNVLIAKYMRFG
jgi:hypothetical protein